MNKNQDGYHFPPSMATPGIKGIRQTDYRAGFISYGSLVFRLLLATSLYLGLTTQLVADSARSGYPVYIVALKSAPGAGNQAKRLGAPHAVAHTYRAVFPGFAAARRQYRPWRITPTSS